MTDVEVCKEICERIMREWTSEARVLLDREITITEAEGLLVIGKLLKKAHKSWCIAKEMEEMEAHAYSAMKSKTHMEGHYSGSGAAKVTTQP